MPSEKKITGYELAVKLRKTRRRHPLTSTEQALFYELVAICNEVDWDDVFVCSNDELCRVLCVSENTLSNARMALINVGLIYYTSGKSKRQYGSYSFTKKLSNPKSPKPTTSNSETVLKTTTSEFEVAAGGDTGVDDGGDAATNPADYIQTETKKKPKPTYASTEASAMAGPENLFIVDTEERKKTSAQKKKEAAPNGKEAETTPHWNTMRRLWMQFYADRHKGIEPSFGPEAGKAMKSILRRLQQHTSTSSIAEEASWTEPNAKKVFTHFLTLAYSDDWLSRHFRISTLSSHYDTIIQINSNEQQQSAKAGRKSDPSNVNSGLKRRVYEQLQGFGSKG